MAVTVVNARNNSFSAAIKDFGIAGGGADFIVGAHQDELIIFDKDSLGKTAFFNIKFAVDKCFFHG